MVKKKTGKKPAKKKVTPNKVASAVYILLDRSGSMGGLWNEVVPSINTYVAGLRGDPDVTLAVFDSSSYDLLRQKVKPANFGEPLAEVSPRGLTPLYDSLGKITTMAFGEDAKRSVLVIMTDGWENDSREVNRAQATALIDKCKSRGWEVIFLGANFDAAPQASSMNVKIDKMLNIAPGFFASGMTTLSAQTTAYAARGVAMNFSDNDRMAAGNFRTTR